jgi:cytochrome c peroxidase
VPKESRRAAGLIVVLVIALLAVALTAAVLPRQDAPATPVQRPTRDEPFVVAGFDALWPDMPAVDADLAALGRLLFYDPILSGSNTLSCASCHHPDLGFSDGRTLALGAHGLDLRRSSPSLWNVVTVDSLFWDGRASSIEEQMLSPLQSADEMGADLTEMLAELNDIPDYARLFDARFNDGITQENVVTAIAAFERSLISRNAPVDRFIGGDYDALTPSQRRGFEIFRSPQARCIECHTWPTFEDDEFHVLGVPPTDRENPDTGRSEIVSVPGARFAFRTPTLRNVVLTAPYMHNGDLKTLDEVIQFYEDGGGGQGIDVRIDEELRGFRLTPQQDADLVAFLHALTDEPAELIEIPESVPSGLPVVAPMDNPARAVSAAFREEAAALLEPRPPQTFVVQPRESIQAAIDRARPGDTVAVEPGVYRQAVTVDVPGITLRGIERDGERPWLDGQDARPVAVIVLADDFTFEGFGIRGYLRGGVSTSGRDGLTVDNILTDDAEM